MLALPLGALLVANEGSGVFSRYESIAPNKVVATSTGYKEVSLSQIPACDRDHTVRVRSGTRRPGLGVRREKRL